MSSAPDPGDEVPEEVLQELIDAVEAGKRLLPKQVLERALDYARQHLDMEHPTPSALWEYILERLPASGQWRYAQLDDYPLQLGYAMRHADGKKLYIKLRFDDQSRVVLMSFHD